ncbi:MAG: hypothetical protein ACOC85_05345 [Thermoplasmatota archaeon]
MVEKEDNGFEYQGNLIYNRIYRTDLGEKDIPFKDMKTIFEENLPEFSQGTPENPGSGYRNMNLKYYLDETEIGKNILKERENLVSIRYIYEKWMEREIPTNGGREVRQIPEERNVDVYWVYPNYVFVRGQKRPSKKTGKVIQEKVPRIEFDRIKFHKDFLLWIIYKYEEGEIIDKKMEVKSLTDSETRGDRDNYGKRQIVHGSTDIAKSLPIIIGILRKKELSMLEGTFKFKNRLVNAEIDTGGRIYLKVSRSAFLKDVNDITRILTSIEFMREFIDLYEGWKKLPNKEKYPPLKFFRNLYEEAKNGGIQINFSIENLLQEYAEKRNENLENIDMSFE